MASVNGMIEDATNNIAPDDKKTIEPPQYSPQTDDTMPPAPAPAPANTSTSSTGVPPATTTPGTTSASSYDPYAQTAPQSNPGILAGQMTPAPTVTAPNTSAQTQTYNANTADSTHWNVDPNQTVQSQVNGIISSEIPLMQRAETKALQSMNQRGLTNSSMAVGAA